MKRFILISIRSRSRTFGSTRRAMVLRIGGSSGLEGRTEGIRVYPYCTLLF